MNTKDLPAMYSTAFWCLFVVLLIFLALLRNRCYSFRSMKGVTVVTGSERTEKENKRS